MAFLSVVVKVVGKRIVDSKSAFRAYYEHNQLSRPPLLIMAEPKKFFACCPRAVMKKVEPAFSDSCELVPAVPSPPPYHLHRNNRPRSHPPHFALTASVPTQPPPQSRRSAEACLHCHYRSFSPFHSRERLAPTLLLSDRHFSSAVRAGLRIVSQAADRIPHRAKTQRRNT
jgi:hypothetical protein